ncbi:uncharacterized protein LOC119182148 isoform X2 [Rhipicephalus microplus]|uniref:uncharacterized protein LOC119182148 isoform X2 n=1 Tax=Rhipicephalus microplus TaxID=6941 RepID=UPI003F6AD8C7
MRVAVVSLILLAIVPIAIEAGIGHALARLLAKLPKALKVLTFLRPRKSIVRILPPPGGFQSGPEGYRGPGISGNPTKFKAGYKWTECTLCKCRFKFNASFYGDKMGCNSSARLHCYCTAKACTEQKMAECANEVAANPLPYA